jgi:hypothetical protein
MNYDTIRKPWARVAQFTRSLDFGIKCGIAAVTLLAGSVNTSHAQSNTAGAVFGRATAGTTVTAEQMGTGSKRTGVTLSDGTFRIGALPPGAYKVTYTDSTGKVQTRQVDVSIGSNTEVAGDSIVQIDKFVVSAGSINPVDFRSTEAVTIFNEKQINLLPIPRDPTSVALLAPGTTQGDTAFGNLASFGGASVAENAYFVNGFNISNFRNGLDPATVPFEFYNEFEIKTGAYSAEFGRSTGGVINASTKSGSNEYRAGANFFFSPDDGRWNAPNSYYTNDRGVVTPLVYNSRDYSQSWQSNAYVSGPIWKNKIFFYGLYQLRDAKREDVVTEGTRFLARSSKDPFWGAKIDILPFDGHRLEYTGFRDESRTTSLERDYALATGAVSGATSTSFEDTGGTTHIGRYTGTFFEKLTVSAMYGTSLQNRTAYGTDDLLPVIFDGRTGSLVYVQGNSAILTTESASDKRKAYRLDAEYPFTLLGSHRVRAGLDREDNLSLENSRYSGGVYMRYYAIPASRVINGAPVPAGATAAVRSRVYRNGGSFSVKSNAWYAEDNWTTLENRLTLRLGIRNEAFENLDSQDKTFIKVTNQFAPRLGASYDLFGNQKTKLFANWGRYHLPVASNTNVRLAGGEFFTEKYNVLTSVDANGKNPVLGAQIGNLTTYSDGSVHDRREIVDMDIRPMYQDEIVIGVQHALDKKLSVGARFINRSLDGTAMDDLIVDHALTAWGKANGFPTFDATGVHAYVLANPGQPIRMFWDFNGNGTLEAREEARLTPQQLQYPSATRKYNAVELFGERMWDGKWNAQVSYTWAQSYGNYEGWVLSDNGQDDAGITQMFDSPLLTRNTYGKLPNDRRHQFKGFGSYALTKDITLGLNQLIASGRPKNRIGTTVDAVAGNYGVAYLLAPRGSVGTTDWVWKTDLALTYRPKIGNLRRVTFQLDVFNIFNNKAVTEVVETAEDAAGGVDRKYGVASSWQSPRSTRLAVSLDF